MAPKTITVKYCAVCNKKIASKEFLKCTSCDRFLDVTCTSNITSKFFRIMTTKTKDVWKCHFCTGNKKQNIALSSKHSPTLPEQSPKRDQIVSDSLHIIAKEPTPSSPPSNNNITTRKKNIINVSTENTFQSLSDEEVFDDIDNMSTYQLNRSCPVGKLNDSHDLEVLYERMELLQNKLGSAEEEIDNLLSENFSLQKRITEQEKKIERLSKICRSPCNITSKRRSSINLNSTNSTPITKTMSKKVINTSQNLSFSADTKTLKKRKIPEKEEDSADRSRTKYDKNSVKHRVLLLADETGRGLRNILQKRLGDEYQVTSSLKPYASLEHVLSNTYVQCQEFTKLDYVIVLAGSHDHNLVKFQSSLYCYLNALTNTNILFGQIGNGARLNGLTLDKFLSSLCPFFGNLYHSQLFHIHHSRKLDKHNTCRSLALDIFKISHINSMCDHKSEAVLVPHINIHSDRLFRAC